MRKLMLVVLFALFGMLFFTGQQSAFALPVVASVNSLEVTGLPRIDGGICGNTVYQPWEGERYVEGILSVTTVDPNYPGTHGGPGGLVAEVFDANGVSIGTGQVSLLSIVGPTSDLSFGVILDSGNYARPWRLAFSEDTGNEFYSLLFDPVDIDSRCGILPYSGVVLAVEQSISDEIAIFGGTDDNDVESLTIFGINDEGEGYFLFDITQADLAPYIDNPPSENTELESVDDVTLYILTTGEYQLNIGPDEEGKVRVIVFEGLPPTNVYSYDFNVYDILDE